MLIVFQLIPKTIVTLFQNFGSVYLKICVYSKIKMQQRNYQTNPELTIGKWSMKEFDKIIKRYPISFITISINMHFNQYTEVIDFCL